MFKILGDCFFRTGVRVFEIFGGGEVVYDSESFVFGNAEACVELFLELAGSCNLKLFHASHLAALEIKAWVICAKIRFYYFVLKFCF